MFPAFDLSQNYIKRQMVSNNVIILTSGTGLGKTTRVPLYAIELFTKKGLNGDYKIKQQEGNDVFNISNETNNFNNSFVYDLPFIESNSIILCAQPKELLAIENGSENSFISKSIKRIEEISSPSPSAADRLTPIIAWKGKNKSGSFSETDKNNNTRSKFGEALTFVTSGWLSKYMINNPYLNKPSCNVSCVIVDEAHERSKDIDILLALLKKILLVRPNFKIIIMSATIDESIFINYFYGAMSIKIEAPIDNTFKVDIVNRECYNYIYEATLIINEILTSNKEGDIIVFVSGNNDINKFIEHIKETGIGNLIEIISISSKARILYNDPDPDKRNKNKRFKTIEDIKKYMEQNSSPSAPVGSLPTKKYIILATNVAESSVTIPSLKFVIDCGISNQANYNAKLDMSFLRPLHITKASADQRKGRVGRKSDGICYQLYSKKNYDINIDKYNDPEILIINLESLFIELLSRNINFLNFDFIEPPSQEQCFYTMEKLKLYEIIPDDYDIYTDLSELKNQTFFNNAQKYNNFIYNKIDTSSGSSHVDSDRSKSTVVAAEDDEDEVEVEEEEEDVITSGSIQIPEILLHILFDFWKISNNNDLKKFMLWVILINTLYVDEIWHKKCFDFDIKCKFKEYIYWSDPNATDIIDKTPKVVADDSPLYCELLINVERFNLDFWKNNWSFDQRIDNPMSMQLLEFNFPIINNFVKNQFKIMYTKLINFENLGLPEDNNQPNLGVQNNNSNPNSKATVVSEAKSKGTQNEIAEEVDLSLCMIPKNYFIIIDSINKTLKKHHNICQYKEITYSNLSGYDDTKIYFWEEIKSGAPSAGAGDDAGADAGAGAGAGRGPSADSLYKCKEFTYVSCQLLNNNFKYNLLTHTGYIFDSTECNDHNKKK